MMEVNSNSTMAAAIAACTGIAKPWIIVGITTEGHEFVVGHLH